MEGTNNPARSIVAGGAHLAVALAARGNQVRCLIRRGSDRSRLAAQVEPVVAEDLHDRVALERLVRGCDAVVHLARRTRSWTPRELYRVNRDGTAALCAALARTNPGGTAHPGQQPGAADRPRRSPPYGHSKLAAERIRHRHPELPITVIRPPAAYGPGDRAIFVYFRLVRLLADLRPHNRPAAPRPS